MLKLGKVTHEIGKTTTSKSIEAAPAPAPSIKEVFTLGSALSTLGGYWPYTWHPDGSISFKRTSFRSIAAISAVMFSLSSIAVMVFKGKMMERIFDFYVGYKGKKNPAEFFGFIVSTWNGVAHDVLLLALNLAWSLKITGCWNNTLTFWNEATSKSDKVKVCKLIQDFRGNSMIVLVTIFALVIWAAVGNSRPLVFGFFQVFEVDFAVGMMLVVGYWNLHSLVHCAYYVFVGQWIYWLGYCYHVVEELIPSPIGGDIQEELQIDFEGCKEPCQTSAKAIEDVIGKTMKLDEIFQDFVDVFKVHLVACLSALGFPILFTLFFTFELDARFQGEDDSFAIVTKAGMAAGFLCNSLTLVFLCCSATYVVNKRNRIPEMLSSYAIKRDIEDSAVKDKLNFFLHRMQGKKLSISPFDFVTFGNQLLASICACVATYMVVLYQFNASNSK